MKNPLNWNNNNKERWFFWVWKKDFSQFSLKWTKFHFFCSKICQIINQDPGRVFPLISHRLDFEFLYIFHPLTNTNTYPSVSEILEKNINVSFMIPHKRRLKGRKKTEYVEWKSFVISWHRHDEIFLLFLYFIFYLWMNEGRWKSPKQWRSCWWTTFFIFPIFIVVFHFNISRKSRQESTNDKWVREEKLFSEAWAMIFNRKCHDHV